MVNKTVNATGHNYVIMHYKQISSLHAHNHATCETHKNI